MHFERKINMSNKSSRINGEFALKIKSKENIFFSILLLSLATIDLCRIVIVSLQTNEEKLN